MSEINYEAVERMKDRIDKQIQEGIDKEKIKKIRERFPKRLTDKEMHSNQQYIELTKQAYMRLVAIEDIIYGEGETK